MKYSSNNDFALYRSNCFGSEMFLGCMDYLIITPEVMRSLAGYVEELHGGGGGNGNPQRRGRK